MPEIDTYPADSPIGKLIDKLIECNNPKTFLKTISGGPRSVFRNPIAPVHLANLLFRSQLCPFNQNR